MDKQSVDKSNMYQVINNFPNQFKKALKFSKGVKAKGSKYSKAIILGMGGSALPGDIINLVISGEFKLDVVRTYDLPEGLEKENVLIILSSYSGNTEEPLEAAEKAKNLGLDIVGVAVGGKVVEWCEENNYPYVKYPNDGEYFQPRMANGYAFTSILQVLINSGCVLPKDKEINNLIKFLESYDVKNEAKKLAGEIKGVVPIIYCSDPYKNAVARIVKIKINENSKTPCFYNYYPESNHNEINGYENSPIKFYFITFFDPKDHPRILKRMEVTNKLYEEKGHKTTMIKMLGENKLEKAYSAIVFGDWLSYYLALEYGIDPTPVDMVENMKRMLDN
ncbi:MAG: bifunctional phosphoglucose/phosphomannose isomerase [bacterium]